MVLEKCPWKGPRILAWFWVKFPEHFMFIYYNFLSATHGTASLYDATHHGRHTNDSIFI